MFKINYDIIDFNLGFQKGFEQEVDFLKLFLYNDSLICIMPIIEWFDSPLSPLQNTYIKNNLYVTFNDILFPTPEDIIDDLKNCKIHWVYPKSDREFKELLENDPYTYSWCIIKNGEYNLRNFEFLLYIEENYSYKETEYRTLIVKEKNPGTLSLYNIYPKIQSYFNIEI